MHAWVYMGTHLHITPDILNWIAKKFTFSKAYSIWPGGWGSVGQNVYTIYAQEFSEKGVFPGIKLWPEQIWEKGVFFKHFPQKGYDFCIFIFRVGSMLKMCTFRGQFLKISLWRTPRPPDYLGFLTNTQREYGHCSSPEDLVTAPRVSSWRKVYKVM